MVRLAQPEECAAILHLLEAQLAEHEIFPPREALRAVIARVLAEPEHGFILLAFGENDEAIGVAYAAAHLSAELGGTVGWLEELYVVPDWRGRGVGGRILAEVTRHARARDWRGLELEVVAGHERAAALYERNAFRRLARTRFSHIFEP